MSALRGTYKSRVAVLRLTRGATSSGAATRNYVKLATVVDPVWNVAGELKCRIDLLFIRPGAAAPPAIQAGQAPPRTGTTFYDFFPYAPDQIRAGDYLQTLAGPVTGIFEVRVIPEPALNLYTANHMEIQIVEVAINLPAKFPDVL